MATELKIGTLSKRTGVAVGALRYYESLNLLQSKRGSNGYRYYPSTAIDQVLFIKKAQTLGFSLEDIGEVLTVHQHGDTPCELVRSLLQDKIERITDQINKLTTFKTELETYRDSWSKTQTRPDPDSICPLIATVSISPETLGAKGLAPSDSSTSI